MHFLYFRVKTFKNHTHTAMFQSKQLNDEFNQPRRDFDIQYVTRTVTIARSPLNSFTVTEKLDLKIHAALHPVDTCRLIAVSLGVKRDSTNCEIKSRPRHRR